MSDAPVPRWRPATGRDRLARRLTTWRRAVLARRRPLATLLTAVAVLASLRTLAPPPEPTARVLGAAHDLDPGAVLGAGDLTAADYPVGTVPDGMKHFGHLPSGFLVG